MNKYRLLFSLLVIGLLLTSCGKEEEANVAPVLDGIAGPDLVVAGGTGTFVATGTDDDEDDLTYTYSTTGGSFTGGNWTAPTTDGRYTISCVANDGTDDSDPLTMEVVVATVPAFAHQWPYNGDGAEVVDGEDVVMPSSASFGTGHVGQAAVFDGADMDYEDAAFGSDTPTMELNDAYSVSLWFATEDSSGFLFGKTYAGVFAPWGENPEDGSAKGLMFGISDDGFYFAFDNCWRGAQHGVSVDRDEDDGAWHHVVVTHVAGDAATDPDLYTIYIDGVAGGSGVLDLSTVPDVDAVITMGGACEDVAYGAWPGAYQGSMDEVVYWDVVLTAAQVTALYDAH